VSLLLKALKQAESAHAGKSGSDGSDNQAEGDLELEPLSPGTEKAREWVEPPGLLFGSNELTPESRGLPRIQWPRLSLVPLTALLAALVALGYGIYLYFALQPPTAVVPPSPAPASAATPVTPAAPVPLEPAPAALPIAPPPPQSSVAPAALPAPAAAPPVTPPAQSTQPTEPARHAATPPSALPLFRPDQQSGLLGQAYAAYQQGALNEAQRLYTQAAARGPNTDALLGLATIASVQNRETEAQRLYREVLDIDPHNATAQGALLDLLGNTDSLATESRLKTLIERNPSPQLYQTLGNLYAGQARWNDAQAAYFEAYRGAPGNADYAFNLAVSLDQLHQYPAALTYYEKALASGGVHRFDRTQAEVRVQQLKSVH
jgi:thioredoxin-like negative regulator of GroEL